MKRSIIENVIGFAIIAITFTFIIFVWGTIRSSKIEPNTYLLTARFQSVDGIVKGSDVMICGIKVGYVSNLELDKSDFTAILKCKIHDSIKIPVDSQAAIITNGLLGNKFVNIIPGISEKYLLNNNQIVHTQSSVNIETIISKMIYSINKN